MRRLTVNMLLFATISVLIPYGVLDFKYWLFMGAVFGLVVNNME